MATMKEYGLIFEDKTVKIAEAVIHRNMFESFCVSGLLADLRKELDSALEKNNYHPLAIIPDTALNGGDYKTTIIRDANEEETRSYLFDYENDWLDSHKCQ